LSGEAFSADLSFRPAIIGHAQARGDWLVQAVAQRRVLHVGFADHVPLIAQRVADGSWLHARVSRSASACWGIDINPEAVQVARSLGFDNVQQLDIFSAEAPAALQHQAPDVVLVPDVIEHLSDPAAFLRRLRLCLPQAQFLVSVPNGLSLRNACHTLRGRSRSIPTTAPGSPPSRCSKCWPMLAWPATPCMPARWCALGLGRPCAGGGRALAPAGCRCAGGQCPRGEPCTP